MKKIVGFMPEIKWEFPLPDEMTPVIMYWMKKHYGSSTWVDISVKLGFYEAYYRWDEKRGGVRYVVAWEADPLDVADRVSNPHKYKKPLFYITGVLTAEQIVGLPEWDAEYILWEPLLEIKGHSYATLGRYINEMNALEVVKYLVLAIIKMYALHSDPDGLIDADDFDLLLKEIDRGKNPKEQRRDAMIRNLLTEPPVYKTPEGKVKVTQVGFLYIRKGVNWHPDPGIPVVFRVDIVEFEHFPADATQYLISLANHCPKCGVSLKAETRNFETLSPYCQKCYTPFEKAEVVSVHIRTLVDFFPVENYNGEGVEKGETGENR